MWCGRIFKRHTVVCGKILQKVDVENNLKTKKRKPQSNGRRRMMISRLQRLYISRRSDAAAATAAVFAAAAADGLASTAIVQSAAAQWVLTLSNLPFSNQICALSKSNWYHDTHELRWMYPYLDIKTANTIASCHLHCPLQILLLWLIQ